MCYDLEIDQVVRYLKNNDYWINVEGDEDSDEINININFDD